jgi:hypothetical protein
MNCSEFHDLIQRRLDGEAVTENGEVAAHVAACPHCRAWQATLCRLEAGLKSLPRPIQPVDLTENIVARVFADQRALRRRRFVVHTTVAIAAAVLVAVLIGQRLDQPQPKAPENPGLAEVPPNPPSTPESGTEAPSLRESVNSVAQLTLRGADETVRSFLPEASANPPNPSPLTSSVASLREAGNSVTTGLEPVTGSAKRALNLFLREFPPTRTQEKRGS